MVGLPEGTWPNLDADKLDGYDSSDFGGGGGCYTNWNSADCAAGYTAVSTGEWTGVAMNPGGGATTSLLICAAPKTADYPTYNMGFVSWNKTGEFGFHGVSHEPCAICCK